MLSVPRTGNRGPPQLGKNRIEGKKREKQKELRTKTKKLQKYPREKPKSSPDSKKGKTPGRGKGGKKTFQRTRKGKKDVFESIQSKSHETPLKNPWDLGGKEGGDKVAGRLMVKSGEERA